MNEPLTKDQMALIAAVYHDLTDLRSTDVSRCTIAQITNIAQFIAAQTIDAINDHGGVERPIKALLTRDEEEHITIPEIYDLLTKYIRHGRGADSIKDLIDVEPEPTPPKTEYNNQDLLEISKSELYPMHGDISQVIDPASIDTYDYHTLWWVSLGLGTDPAFGDITGYRNWTSCTDLQCYMLAASAGSCLHYPKFTSFSSWKRLNDAEVEVLTKIYRDLVAELKTDIPIRVEALTLASFLILDMTIKAFNTQKPGPVRLANLTAPIDGKVASITENGILVYSIDHQTMRIRQGSVFIPGLDVAFGYMNRARSINSLEDLIEADKCDPKPKPELVY